MARVVRLEHAHSDPLFYRARVEYISAGNIEAVEILRSGKADLGFVPITYSHEFLVIPKLAIYSTGPVISSRVFRGTGIGYAAVEDTTVSALAVAKLMGVSFARIKDVEKALEEYEGVLVIGNKALELVSKGVGHIVDVGELWQERVGKPLVYAVLAARRGVNKREAERAVEELENSLAQFYENPRPLIKAISNKLNIKENILFEYYNRIKYYVNNEVLEGLDVEFEILGLKRPNLMWI